MAPIDWAGKEMFNDAGYIRYTAIHAWRENGSSLCGVAEPAGAWIEEGSGGGSICKRCRKISRYQPSHERRTQ